MLKYKISGFADEIDTMVDNQFTHLNKLGISHFEPRGIDGVNISDLTDEQCDILLKKMKKHGISVSSIGSPIGKISINDAFEPHKEKLRRTAVIAKKLGAKYIRIFSFYIPEGEPYENYRDEVMRRMKEMCAVAEEEGVMLLHENEKGIYGDIAPRCLDILKTVNSPVLRAVFDPANFVQCGQKTYPEAYDMLAPYIEYMHIKDATENGDVVPSGMGAGRLYEILSALSKADYNGFLSLEPHLGSFSGLDALETDDKMTKLEKSSAEKFTLAYESLMKIIERVQNDE